jgi:hypothetical protein
MRQACLASSVVLVCSVALGAMQATLDRRALEEAMAIGQSRIAVERSRFHAPYTIAVARAPVDAIHVVTPFRRVVVTAEEQARRGDRAFGQKQALDALTPDQLDIYVELTFHPFNTYIGVPVYETVLVDPRTMQRMLPRGIERFPRFGPKVEGSLLPSAGTGGPLPPPGSQSLLGGTIVAGFDTTILDPDASYEVVVGESGKELARVRVDLAKLR